MRRWFVLSLVVAAVGAAAFVYQSPDLRAKLTGFVAQKEQAARTGSRREQGQAVPVVMAQVTRKPMPVSFATIGTVQPIASIAIVPQVSGRVIAVKADDGAEVNEGDVLVEIDARLIDTQIEQAKAQIAKDQLNVEKAKRDYQRIAQLLAKNFETRENQADAQTNIDLANAAAAADQAALDYLNIQREYYTIKAPVRGRVGTFSVKPGSTVVAGANATQIVTLNAFDPIYVAVGIPQKMIAELNEDKTKGLSRVHLTVPGRDDKLDGPVTVIDNSADQSTGLVTMMATIANPKSLLWPGEVVNVNVVFREETDALVVPGEAVETNQQGNYVYTVDETGHAHVSPVVVERTVERMAVIASGVKEGDNVVVDGQLQLSEGAAVATRQAEEGQ